MRKSICICLAIILLQGCSAIINQIRVDNIKKNYSKLIVGTPRSEIIETFGKPIKKEGNYIDFYTLCLPEESWAMGYIVNDIGFRGLSEIFTTPYEALRSCHNKENMVLIYDKNEILNQILKEKDYNSLLSIYEALLNEVDECSADNNFSLIRFDYEDGWIYVSKNEIECNFIDNFTKIYVTEIPSLKKIIQYEPSLEPNKVPVRITKTILIDHFNDQFMINSIFLYSEDGQVLKHLPDQTLRGYSSDSNINSIAGNINIFCLIGILSDFYGKEKPQLIDFLSVL